VQRKRKEIRQGGLCSEKGKKSDGEGCMLQSLIFLFSAVEIPSFYDDPVPTNFLLISSSIESLILSLFNLVLGPKKSFESGLRTWAKILLAAGIPAFTLDFKHEYLELLILKSSNSKAKFIYMSQTTTLMKDSK
jgi:hypothetical protein